jgi:peroxiredoxin
MLQAGDKVPGIALPDDAGVDRSLSGWRGSWLVLWFYSKDATPG